MADPSATPDPADAVPRSADREPHTGTPRWVKVFAVVGALLILLLVVMLLAGGHGPGRHTGSRGDAPSSAVIEHSA